MALRCQRRPNAAPSRREISGIRLNPRKASGGHRFRLGMMPGGGPLLPPFTHKEFLVHPQMRPRHFPPLSGGQAGCKGRAG